MENFNARILNTKELNARYGDRQIPVGKCFTSEGHFYLQREDSVLHVSAGKDLINTLHVGYLNNKKTDEVTTEKFKLAVAETIYSLELDKFWDV